MGMDEGLSIWSYKDDGEEGGMQKRGGGRVKFKLNLNFPRSGVKLCHIFTKIYISVSPPRGMFYI